MKKDSHLKYAMRISVIEGIFAQFHTSLTSIGSNFITKAAVVLNASPLQFSMLTGVSQLSQFFQLYAVKHNRDVASRKKPCIRFAFWGRLLSMLIGLSFAVSNTDMALLYFLVILFSSSALQTVSGNMWVAWISDLIPKKLRGRFFSQRMQIHLVFAFITGYFFSFFIDLFEAVPGTWRNSLVENFHAQNFFNIKNLPLALSLLFIIGSSVGLYGLKFLHKQPERKIRSSFLGNDFSLFDPLKNEDFRKLLRFGLWWMFAIGVGSPFWGPFMIKELKMTLVEMQIYTMLSSFAMFISFRFWGKFTDKYGNKTAMKICVFLGGLNPLFWVFFRESSYSLIWLEGFFSGIMWSGANLVSFNIVLAISPRGKEQQWSAVYQAFGGVAMLSSILLSGLIYPPRLVLAGLVILPEQILFGLTGLLRLSAEIPLYFVNEPKAIPLRKTFGDASDIVLARIMRFRNKMFKISKF